jgi:hypothetical protein
MKKKEFHMFEVERIKSNVVVSSSLEEKVQAAIEIHEKVFTNTRESGGNFYATAGMILSGRAEFIAMPQWGGDHREDLSQMLHDHAKQNSVLAIVFADDGWYLSHDSPNLNKMRPSEAPDRREALSILTIWPDGSVKAIFRPYHMEESKIVWEPEMFKPDDETVHTEQHIVKPWIEISSTIQ